MVTIVNIVIDLGNQSKSVRPSSRLELTRRRMKVNTRVECGWDERQTSTEDADVRKNHNSKSI